MCNCFKSLKAKSVFTAMLISFCSASASDVVDVSTTSIGCTGMTIAFPVDFEHATCNYQIAGFDGGAASLETGPDGDGSLKYVKGAGQNLAGVSINLDKAVDAANGEIVTVDVHSTVARFITLKFDAAGVERLAGHGGTGWESLSYDFTGAMPTDQTKIAFFNDLSRQGDGTDAWTIYIDNLLQTGQTSVAPGPVDSDNDGVNDDEDAFPNDASETVDSDNDVVGNNSDAFPNDSSETVDTDLDGIGNNADDDDDNDGIADADDSDPLNDAIGALELQSIFVMGNPIAVNGYLTTISVGYDVSDANAQLTGIGYRVHYDSSIFSLSEIQNTLANSIVVDGFGPYQDVENFDNDNTTDSYITFAWASVGGDWPNVELPAQLTDINLFVNWANYEAGSTTSNINFSFIDNAQGYESKATNYEITVLPATWDFDGDGVADALTDGLMMLRYAFGIQTLDMTVDAISTTATLTPVQIVDSMYRAAILADIDGDDSTDALTDGLLLLRYLFGLRGESLINGVVSFDAARTTAEEIEEYIELYMPPEVLVTETCSPDEPCESTGGSGTSTTSSIGTAGITNILGWEGQMFMVGDWKLASKPEKRIYHMDALQEWDDYPWEFTQTIFDSCVADDIYRFGETGTFELLFNGSTFIDSELNPLYDSNDETSSSCVSPTALWTENQTHTYSIWLDNNRLTVHGDGAYIALAHVANGPDDPMNAAFPGQSISYDYTKISDTEVLLEIGAYDDFYRFTLEKVVD
jgi:hypothetical protein